jgi:paraquat-inducible protein B
MGLKINYFKLGLFVLSAAALIIITIIGLSAGMFGSQKIYIETYFDESVQGLSSGSAVHYRGFPIGKVERISFVSYDYEFPQKSPEFETYRKYVRVIFSLEDSRIAGKGIEALESMIATLIEQGGRIRLTQQPLTGVSYLGIDFFDPHEYPAMQIGWKPQYMYIPSAPSMLSTFTQSAEAAFKQLATVDIAKISKDADEMMISIRDAFEGANVAQVSNEIQSFFAEIRQTNAELKKIVASADPEKFTTLPETIERFDRTLAKIEIFINTRSNDFGQIVSNIKAISVNVKELSDELKKNPSRLILSRHPAKSEVLK